MDSYDISTSAMSAQRLRLDVIASNLANMNSSRSADGSREAYRRRNVVFAPLLDQKINETGLNGILQMKRHQSGSGQVSFQDGMATLSGGVSQQAQFNPAGVQVVQVSEDTKTPLKRVFDEGNPDADKDGYVNMPNINPVTEMVDMIAATRAYEANVTSLQATKSMGKAALEI
jgi:flagellar basal-body rod protein FlgC